MEIFKDRAFQRRIVFINGILPAILLILDLYEGRLGANPPEAVIRSTGVFALVFFVLTIAVTPMMFFLKWSWLAIHRRTLGLFSFFYACLHLLSYSVFDKSMQLTEILTDIRQRPFILLGFSAFLIMLPLAMTSSNRMVHKMGGKKWKRLHRWTYFIAPLAVTHYWLIIKSDFFYPAIFAAILVVLLAVRLIIKSGNQSRL